VAPFDDLPIPPVDSVTRVASILRSQRVGAIQLPPGVVPPVGQRLMEEWRRRRDRGEPEGASEEASAEAGSIPAQDVDPPETYGEHGELLHPHDLAATEGLPRLDLEA
jgi:hypothetical protein